MVSVLNKIQQPEGPGCSGDGSGSVPIDCRGAGGGGSASPSGDAVEVG